MRRFILFSQPNEVVLSTIEDSLFPSEFENKTLAYIPADGNNPKNASFLPFWEQLTAKHKAKLIPINNALPLSAREADKVASANIVMITGGNTFVLARNLRQSGIDKAIQEVSRIKDFVIAGFSAGAIILGPSIELAAKEPFSENIINYDNLDGLKLVGFAVFPHYQQSYSGILNDLQEKVSYKIKPLADHEYFISNI